MKRLKLLLISLGFMATAGAQRQFVMYYDGQRIVYDESKLDSMKFVTQTKGNHGGYEYVDLGLSVKWASKNLGATNITDTGEQFQWSENIPFGMYDSYDDGWYVPTRDDYKEMIDKCVWRWQEKGNTNYDGIAGYEIEGTNGNTIFMPASGYINISTQTSEKVGEVGYYWTSEEKSAENAYNLRFTNTTRESGELTSKTMMFSIRPVLKLEEE